MKIELESANTMQIELEDGTLLRLRDTTFAGEGGRLEVTALDTRGNDGAVQVEALAPRKTLPTWMVKATGHVIRLSVRKK